MRVELALGFAMGVAACFVGCGAKVTVDTLTGGQGGSGGTHTITTYPGVTIQGETCVGVSEGCACSATAVDTSGNPQAVQVQCAPIGGGMSCNCILNSVSIKTCQQATTSCHILAGCCAEAFFGGS